MNDLSRPVYFALAFVIALLLTAGIYFNNENNLLPHYGILEATNEIVMMPYTAATIATLGWLAFMGVAVAVVVDFVLLSAIFIFIFRVLKQKRLILSLGGSLIALSALFAVSSYVAYADYSNNQMEYCLNGTLATESYNRTTANECLDSLIFNLLYRSNSKTPIATDDARFRSALDICQSVPDVTVHMPSDHWAHVYAVETDNSRDFCLYILASRMLTEESRKVEAPHDPHLIRLTEAICTEATASAKCQSFFEEGLKDELYWD